MPMTPDDEVFDYYRSLDRFDNERIDQAIRIYDEVLVPDCKAYRARGREDNSMRQQFVHWFAEGAYGNEFRFQGDLGFGGKFWDTTGKGYGEWRVSYYNEDRTKERDSMEAKANEHLHQLMDELGVERGRF